VSARLTVEDHGDGDLRIVDRSKGHPVVQVASHLVDKPTAQRLCDRYNAHDGLVDRLPSTPAAKQTVELAMVHVEKAQHELERACQALSSLRHGSDLCTKAGKLRDACHAFFYVLRKAADTRGGMSQDNECEKCFADLSGWRMGMPTHRCAAAEASP
jgi:hypothetical protein